MLTVYNDEKVDENHDDDKKEDENLTCTLSHKLRNPITGKHITEKSVIFFLCF